MNKVQCDNCREVFHPDEIIPLEEVEGLGERLDPGSIVPAGECKLCGALAYYIDKGVKRCLP